MKKTLIKLLVLVVALSAVMCFAVGCNHSHNFDKQNASSEYLSEEATCLSVAKYFYSCACGEKGEETFEYGEALGHDFGAWASNGDDTHTRICSRNSTHVETVNCHGGVKTCSEQAVCEDCNTAYGGKEAHVFEEQVAESKFLKSKQTCYKKATYYYSCKCGEKGTDYFEYGEIRQHMWSKWQTSHGGGRHYRYCQHDGNNCGATQYEDCYGGTATCTAKATCTVCKNAYGSTLGHDWNEWVSNGNNIHTRTCKNDSRHTEEGRCSGGEAPCETKSICKDCHSEYGTVLGHKWSGWYSNNDGTHYRYCTSNNSHRETGNCSGGTPTCENKATCKDCKTAYGETLGGHKWSEWTSNGDDTHTRVCANDSNHVETKDCHGGDTPCETESICEDCKTAYGTVLGHDWSKWCSKGDKKTHYRWCKRNGNHTETEECSGGTAYCYKLAVCEVCNTGYGETLAHEFGEYAHYKDATCVDYAKLRAKCTTQGCNAYLEKDDLTKPPKGSHTWNSYDRCADCGEKRATCIEMVGTKEQGETSFTITSIGSCSHTEVIIPQYSNGCVFTRIDNEAFNYIGSSWSNEYKSRLANITKVTIPASITYIGEKSFYRLPALETVIIEGDNVVIDAQAFYMCENLKTVILLGDNIQIGNEAFSKCIKLETLEIEGYFSKLGKSAFSGCTSLKDIELKQGLIELDDYSLYNTAIENVVVPKSVNKVGNGVFGSCKNLKSATFNCTPNSFGTHMFSGCSVLSKVKLPTNLTSIPNNTFATCTMLTTIDIPSGITSIGDSAFDSTSLTSITIPKGVSSIGRYAFRYCYKLTEVVNKSSLAISIGATQNGYVGHYAVIIHNGDSRVVNQNDFLFIADKGENYLLGYVGSETEITLPDNFNGKEYSIYKYAFNGATTLTKITLSDGVASVGEKVFEGCNSSIFTVVDGVNYLGTATNPYYAVIGPVNKNLTACSIESNAKVFADKAFYGCSSLTTINVPNGLKHFGFSALDSCSKLTYNVKDGINYLGDATNNYVVVMGANDTTLTSYVVEDGAKFLNYASFWNCSSATTIELPSSLIYIENGAFNFCSNLKSMVIPEGITKIGDTMFGSCNSLTSVKIPESVVSLGTRAFYECRNLKEIELPAGLVSIGDEAFYSSGIVNIKIPEGVTYIGDRTFNNCGYMEKIVIGKGVTAIGKDSFYYCSKLYGSYYPNNGIYFEGTAEDFAKITVVNDNGNYLSRANKFFYVENEEDVPTDGGKYWHYVDGVPTAW